MKNAWLCMALTGVLLLNSTQPDAAIAADAREDLPIRRVVLFTSGVAFFEHRGSIDGDLDVGFTFHNSQVNDLLKSMVVQDLGGGRVTAVTYDSPEPTETTLRSFRVDLADNPSIADLLQQVRGHEIQLIASKEIDGTVVGTETRPELIGDELTDVTAIILSTEHGLLSVPLYRVQAVRLLDPQLDRDLHEALQVLSSTRRQDKKSVQLHFRGSGNRDVSVGYVQEFPLWKTSYRLGPSRRRETISSRMGNR